MRRGDVAWLTRGALIAALYVALTVTPPLNAISYGGPPLHFNFRISEALSVLAFFEPAAIPGLFVGCILANLWSPFGAFDVITGSLYTLIAAYMIWKIRKPAIALLSPVVINALGVALTLHLFLDLPYWLGAASVAVGEVVVIYGLGYPLLKMLLKRGILVREGVFRQKMGE